MKSCILLGSAALFLATACAVPPDLSPNPFSSEPFPLVLGMVPAPDGFTLAQTRNAAGAATTLLVTQIFPDGVEAIDLAPEGAPVDADIFDAVAAVGTDRLSDLLAEAAQTRRYPSADLLSPAGTFDRHLASGTNFAEHQEETSSTTVFNFPKFGPATPPVTTVDLKERVLLDYEVEICVRFDRDIETIADFDAAQKGFFLCGDFTDRAALVELINRQNPASGIGFSDAKSGKDFFPTGSVLVIPRDWSEFVKNERITTKVNGQLRQDARGKEMILDFRQLTEKAIADGTDSRFVYKGEAATLLQDGKIKRGSVLMSGTAEGVIFRMQTKADASTEAFIERELRDKRYLQPDDVVLYESSTMGNAAITVVDKR